MLLANQLVICKNMNDTFTLNVGLPNICQYNIVALAPNFDFQTQVKRVGLHGLCAANCSAVEDLKTSGQSYKQFTIIIYASAVKQSVQTIISQ